MGGHSLLSVVDFPKHESLVNGEVPGQEEARNVPLSLWPRSRTFTEGRCLRRETRSCLSCSSISSLTRLPVASASGWRRATRAAMDSFLGGAIAAVSESLSEERNMWVGCGEEGGWPGHVAFLFLCGTRSIIRGYFDIETPNLDTSKLDHYLISCRISHRTL